VPGRGTVVVQAKACGRGLRALGCWGNQIRVTLCRYI